MILGLCFTQDGANGGHARGRSGLANRRFAANGVRHESFRQRAEERVATLEEISTELHGPVER